MRALLNDTIFQPLPNRLKPLGREGAGFIDLSEGSFRVYAEVSAKVASQALENCLQRLRRVLDVANFYHRSAPFSVGKHAFVQSATSSAPQRIIEVEAVNIGWLRPQRAATDIAAALQRSGLFERLPDQIISSLEQHSVAQAATDLRIRFGNLWTALETLVGRGDESIIDRMTRSIVPLIVHRRVNKIIKYLAICLHSFGLCDTISDSTGWFRRSNRKAILPEELVLVFTNAAGEGVMRGLLRLTSAHPLLCNRLFTGYQDLIDPRQVAKQLRESRQRTEWQLRRI